MKHSFLTIDGVAFPTPKRGVNIKIMTTVSDGRSESNVFKGQKVGRDLQKIENVIWPFLDADTWSVILKKAERFTFNVTYLDPVSNDWITRKMYVSDRECQPYKLDPNSGKTIKYAECKCSFVDAGE